MPTGSKKPASISRPMRVGKPSLKQCLAYVVLSNRRRWLGDFSPMLFNNFLDGAADRAHLTGETPPQWRIYGPLGDPKFSLPIVAQTGHPTLSIRWSTAMEFLHFSHEDAALDLLKRMRAFVARHGLDCTPLGMCECGTFQSWFSSMARRPGMYLGHSSGWALRSYLAGMNEGGDWLGLPRLSGLRRTIRAIEGQSRKSYGSPFAAYRMYDAAKLLGWAGIEPDKE